MTRVKIAIDTDEVRIPGWVNDLESFRRWTDDEDFPEFGRISFLDGEVSIDMSKEQVHSHVAVKAVINYVLYGITLERVDGRFYPDGLYLSNEEANISNQPDGCVVLTETRRSGRVQVVDGRHDGFVEIEGAPDLVIEIVSNSSVQKDTILLRERYAAAGIREYWLIDARVPPLSFLVLRLGKNGYSPSRKSRGWSFSAVLGHWFRLSEFTAKDGDPKFKLEYSENKPTD